MTDDESDPNSRRKANAVDKSNLRHEADPNMWPIVYHSIYNIGFMGIEKLHPFDAGKWGKIYGYLKDEGLISDDTIVTAREATEDDLLVVHTKGYLRSLTWSAKVAMIMEVPVVAFFPNFLVQRKALRPFRYHVGGTVMAAHMALQRGWGLNLGGGFHHCSSDQGGGFCAYADITIALQFLFLQGLVQRATIIDLDAHQGNGHERDFMRDERVYIMDMFNAYIYPFDDGAKPAIRQKIELRHRTADQSYLNLEEKYVKKSLDEFKPDIIVYNAGTDVLAGDPLGCLDISPEGIIQRDEILFRIAREAAIPVVMVTSGGYQRTNARIIADSIINLHAKGLISGPAPASAVDGSYAGTGQG